MNKMSDSQRRKIFILAGEKGLDDALLHEFIYKITGKDSLKDLNIKDAMNVIDGLAGKKQNASNMITDKQQRFIEGLAKELGWVDENNRVDKARLNGWISSKFNVDKINWLTAKKASDVIEGLKVMKSRIQEAV